MPNDDNTDHLFDIDEVSKLLQVPALIANNTPQHTAILAESMARLHKINAGLAEHHRKRKEREAKAPTEVPGQPVANPKPSEPIEAPKSQVAKEAPKAQRTTIEGMPGPAEAAPEPPKARAIPSTTVPDRDHDYDNNRGTDTTAADAVRRL